MKVFQKGQEYINSLLPKELFFVILHPVMEKLKLEERKITGKKTKSLRNDGNIPAVVYNSKGDSTNISIEKGSAVQLYREATPTTILDLEIGKKELKAIVKEFDINPRNNEILHVSFFEIDPKAQMDFTLPFTLEGVSPAVKNNLGILVQISNSIQVRCKVDNLIPEIVIDVTGLEHPGQTISMEDISLPEGLELVHKEDSNLPIATITQLQKIEVVEEEAVEEGEEGEETEGENIESENSEESDKDSEETAES
jgi:large subunit ribosomal protein L25